MLQNVLQRKIIFLIKSMQKSQSNCKETNSLDLTSFLCVGLWVVYEWCQLSTCAENIQWFSAKAVLTNFFIGASSHEGVFSGFAFTFQMVVKLQRFTVCEWNEKGRCHQNGLAAFYLFFSFFLSSNVAWDLANWITVKC